MSNMTEGHIEAVGPDKFRKTLSRFPSGVIIVTANVDGQVHGMTASAFCSVSLNPPLVAVAIDQNTLMHQHLQKGRAFGISILAKDQHILSDHFGGRPRDEVSLRLVEVNGHWVVHNALAHIGCSPAGQFEAGDHTMYLGRVEYVNHREDDEPLIHYAGEYRVLAAPRRG
jgi:flavin reductase (DIM6/NTAB) family NADH-FMN oxidoreductase RutF